jgi:anion transporter
VSYALAMTDVTLASGMSITARSGGIVLPVARSIAELYESRPGPTANRLGRFLMMALYQGSAVSCAMFLTGQASNVLVAGFAARLAGVTVTWSSWFVAALLPGLVSCAVVPFVVLKILPPEILRTPAAAGFARVQLEGMGPLRRDEMISLVVFTSVILLWMTTAWHGVDVAVVAMGALGALLLTNVLPWENALREHAAWDIFVWYGGLLTMGEVLNETGSTAVFAQWVGGSFTGLHWLAVLILAGGVLLRALRLRQRDRARAGDVPAVRGDADWVGHAAARRGIFARLHGQPDGRSHSLRDDDGADGVRRGLRHVARLVESGPLRLVRKPGDLVDGWIRVVEAPRVLVNISVGEV